MQHPYYEKTHFQFLSRPFNHALSERKLLEKDFKSIIETDNLYSVAVEDVVVAETNEFL